MTTTRKDPVAARYFMLDAAVARDDARQALKHIYCDGGNIVATNGKILVYTNNDEALKPGFYDLVTTGTGRDKRTKFVPVTDEKAKEWNYPNWKQVVPNCTEGKTLEFNGGAAERELEVFKLQFALASMGTGALIGQEYIDLLCKPQLTLNVRIIDGLVPVIFELPSFYSVLVMPRRATQGKSEVNKILEAFKAELIAAAKTAPEPLEPKAESAGEPEKAPEPEKPAEPAQAATEPGPVAAPMPEPVEMPQTRRKAPEAAKAAPEPKRRKRKPAFSYICELKDGSRITLDSIEAVRERGDVTKCRIEPVKRSRKAA